MNWFVRNALVVNIFVLLAAFCWIHGGTRPDHLLPVIPWLTFFVLQIMIVFPQAKSTEDLADARVRVWQSLRRDPLTWIALFLLVLLVIPLFNVAGKPLFDTATQRWVNPTAPISWLPSCALADQHAVLLLWFPPALTAALAARHALLKRGKRLLLELICWNGALLAALGFAQLATGTDSLLWFVPLDSHFFSTFGYPNFAGAFFTLVFALACGIWAFDATLFLHSEQAAAQKNFFYRNRMLLPAALNFFAALATLSRAAILLAALVLAAFLLYMILFCWQRVSHGARIKIFAGIFAGIALMAISLLVFDLKSFSAEVKTISLDAVVDRVSGSGYHARVAREIYRDHPVFGVGGWGYPHYKMQYMTPVDLKRMQVQGGVNVHNDSLQFLAEQGYVGFGALVACALALALPLWIALFRLIINSFRVAKADPDMTSPAGHWFYCIPVPLVAVFMGTAATLAHSLGDLPFRSPAVLTVWTLAFACVPGWIPEIKRRKRA